MTNDEHRKSTVEDLQSLFNLNDIFSARVTELRIEASRVANIKTPAKLEQEVLKNNQVRAGDLAIIEWKNLQEDILVSSDRTIFVSDKVCKSHETSFTPEMTF